MGMTLLGFKWRKFVKLLVADDIDSSICLFQHFSLRRPEDLVLAECFSVFSIKLLHGLRKGVCSGILF